MNTIKTERKIEKSERVQKGAAESNPAHFMPFANYGDDAVDTWQSMQLCCLYMCYNTF